MKIVTKTLVCAALVLCVLVQPFAALPAGVATTANAAAGVTVKKAKTRAPGYTKATRIAGIVWNDADGDGRMENQESVLSGVQVRLLAKREDADALRVDETPEPGADGVSGDVQPAVQIGDANSDPNPQSTPEPTGGAEQKAQDAGRATEIKPEMIEVIDVDVPLADGYVVLMSTVSDSNGWYAFTGMAPGKYVVAVAGLGDRMSVTAKRSNHSVIDPETWRSGTISIKKDTSHADNKHIGVIVDSAVKKDMTTDSSDVTPTPEATIAPEVTIEPEETVAPEETTEPEETVAPEETVKPEETIEPEETVEPLVLTDPEDSEAPISEALPCECRDEGGACVSGEDCVCGCHDVEDEEVQAVQQERGVAIFSTLSDVISEGDPVTLSSVLTGFDGLVVSYQWQYRAMGGEWEDMAGATGSSYTFAATPEKVSYEWRLLVSFDE